LCPKVGTAGAALDVVEVELLLGEGLGAGTDDDELDALVE